MVTKAMVYIASRGSPGLIPVQKWYGIQRLGHAPFINEKRLHYF